MSAAFSIKLGDVVHKFLYNHIKLYCTYKAYPTIYLQTAWSTVVNYGLLDIEKRYQLGDLCKNIFCVS